MARPSKQRDYPQLLVFDITNVRAVIRKAFDWIFQLDASLEALKAKVDVPVTVPSAVGYLEDLHSQRETVHAPANLPLGSTYYETDRKVTYQVRMVDAAKAWVYLSGIYRSVQASKPTDLGDNDSGFLWEAIDYAHTFIWNGPRGAGWYWNAGDSQSGFVQGFAIDPTPTIGWKLCGPNGDDGQPIGVSHPVSYMIHDGTLGYITSNTVYPLMPYLNGNTAYMRMGGTVTGVTAAVAPTINTEPTVSSDSAGTPTGTVNSRSLSTGGFTAGASNAVVQDTHDHTFTGNAMAGHNHTLSGGTLNADAEMKSFILRPWFRK